PHPQHPCTTPLSADLLEPRLLLRHHHPQNTSHRQTQQADGGQEALLNLHRLFGSAIETVACKHQHEQRWKGIKKIERIDVWEWPDRQSTRLNSSHQIT